MSPPVTCLSLGSAPSALLWPQRPSSTGAHLRHDRPAARKAWTMVSQAGCEEAVGGVKNLKEVLVAMVNFAGERKEEIPCSSRTAWCTLNKDPRSHSMRPRQ